MTMKHGTASTYRNHGCRCSACREAARAAHADWKATVTSRDALRHDNSTYVNYGCRCETCKAAHSAYERQRYQGAS